MHLGHLLTFANDLLKFRRSDVTEGLQRCEHVHVHHDLLGHEGLVEFGTFLAFQLAASQLKAFLPDLLLELKEVNADSRAAGCGRTTCPG